MVCVMNTLFVVFALVLVLCIPLIIMMSCVPVMVMIMVLVFIVCGFTMASLMMIWK